MHKDSLYFNINPFSFWGTNKYDYKVLMAVNYKNNFRCDVETCSLVYKYIHECINVPEKITATIFRAKSDTD